MQMQIFTVIISAPLYVAKEEARQKEQSCPVLLDSPQPVISASSLSVADY